MTKLWVWALPLMSVSCYECRLGAHDTLCHTLHHASHTSEVCRPMLVILYPKEWSHIQTFILHVLFLFFLFCFISLVSTHHHNHPRRADLFISDCLCCSSHSLPCVCMSLPPLLSLFSSPRPHLPHPSHRLSAAWERKQQNCVLLCLLC